jgi:hypothetical protein
MLRERDDGSSAIGKFVVIAAQYLWRLSRAPQDVDGVLVFSVNDIVVNAGFINTKIGATCLGVVKMRYHAYDNTLMSRRTFVLLTSDGEVWFNSIGTMKLQ